MHDAIRKSVIEREKTLREDLDHKVARILRWLLEDQRFVNAYTRGAQTLLSSVADQGWRVALVLVPESVGKPLSPRQRDVAELVGQGLGNRGIAEQLGIGEETVKSHLTHICERWDVHSRAGIARGAAVMLS